MKAHAHALSGCAAWTGGCLVARHLGVDVGTAAVVGGALVVGGYGIAPDVDVQGTAARSLGWITRGPAYVIGWLTEHRGATHTVALWVGLGAALQFVTMLADSTLAAVVVFLGLVWCEAGFAADDRPSRRRGMIARGLLGALGTWLVLRTGDTSWVPWAVATGGLAHLAGDCLTRSKFRLLAPFYWREIGGLGIIPPTPHGQRVTWQERLFEVALWLATVLATGALLGTPVAVLLILVTVLGNLRYVLRHPLRSIAHPVRTTRRVLS